MRIDQLGPYRIVRELGRGGMGVVYEGVNLETDEPAAIKLLSAPLADEEGFRDRFEVEIETLLKLKHPNIVRLFGFGQQEGDLFYAMELVHGSSLERELRQGRRFNWREVTHIGVDVCQALRHAHDRGVIHRDIKPGNLLMSDDGHVKLSDFGIARLFGNTQLTHAGSVLGTAEYMAPEQAGGQPVDPRADLYSLGAVLYVLLTRQSLFSAKTFAEILQKQQFETPDRVSAHASDVPAILDKIIAQLLEKDPQRRIPNAMLLARQLEAMEHALSLHGETASGATNSSNLAPPVRNAVGLEPGELPPTRSVDTPGPAPPMTEPSENDVPAAGEDDLPDTKATAAFQNIAAADTAESQEPDAQFTTVAEEELDRLEHEEARTPWISPQTWGLIVGLIAVGLTVWYFLQPPSAEHLYEKIRTRTATAEIAALRQAKDDIREFLTRFPNDTRCRQLREYEREIELDRLEKEFERRAKGLLRSESLPPIKRDYLEAINYARLDPERGMVKLKALIALYDHGRDRSGLIGRCLELARRRVARLQEQFDQETAQHLSQVQDRLRLAEQLRRSEPDRAEAMYRAVIELYQDKPWAAEVVRQARQALHIEEVPQRENP